MTDIFQQLSSAVVEIWVWMVIAGPALVVVASFATYYIAVSGMDKVIDEPVAVSAPTKPSQPKGFAPAVQARNRNGEPPLNPDGNRR